MKKFLLTVSLLFTMLIPQVNADTIKYATVFSPTTGWRKAVVVGDPFAFAGDKKSPDGYLLETSYNYIIQSPGQLGFTVVSNYKTTLSRSISSTATTIYVSSLTTKDSHVLTMADLGSKVFLTIEPGSNKEEIVMCTGIGTLSWTTCTRGMAFYGTSTAAVAANQKTHSAGSAIVMSNVHYVYDELVDKDTADTITAVKTYTVSPIVPYSTASSSAASVGYTNATVTAGAPDANETTKGISELATGAEAAAGTSSGSAARLVLPASIATTTADVAGNHVAITDTDGKLKQDLLDLTEDFTFSGTNTFATSTMATTTFSGVVLGAGFGGDGSDGALSVEAGATTTLSIGSAVTLVKNYTSITIPATAGLAFSLPNTNGSIITLKSQGDCTIGGFIDMRQIGAASTTSVTIGKIGYGVTTNAQAGTAGVSGSGGTAGAASANSTANFFRLSLVGKIIRVTPGASGGGGGNDSTGILGGRGGDGGGALIIECAGALNFTGSINASGQNGSVGAANINGGGGGGGGAGGTVAIVYNLLTANSGTININGGNGGNGGDGNNSGTAGDSGGGGGGGGANLYLGGGGCVGNAGNASFSCNGTTGGGIGGGTGGAKVAANGNGGGGGGGSAGGSYVVQNTEF